MKTRYLALALAAAISLPALAHAQQGPIPPNAPRVSVSGEGEATVSPDIALLSLSVMREAATAREALSANNDAMAAVIAAMKADGVADRDLQTASIQIQPRYTYTNNADGTQKSELTGYQVFNTLSVRVRDIAKTGTLLDKAVTLGVNQGGGITFTNDDPSKTITEARKRAVADAVSKARTLAEAADVKLGRVIEISEQSFAQPPMPMMVKAQRMEAADSSVPVEAGENSYKVQVNVTFELK